MTKKKYKYNRTGISLGRDVHARIKAYCNKNHPGMKLFVCVENILNDFLKGKEIFLP